MRSAAILFLLAATGTLPAAESYRQESAGATVLRVASFNAALNRFGPGGLIDDLRSPDDQLGPGGSDTQVRAVAEIIQRTQPDILLLNEFDYDAAGDALALFQRNYLAVSQNGATPVDFSYAFIAPSNTGIPSGFDLNNDGTVGGPDDAYGFGFFEGQYGMALLSRFPIDEAAIRTFQHFLWADMPGALLPQHDPDGDGRMENWYSDDELEVVRLSSKSHWDVPVTVGEHRIHVLAAHPTPPVFDGDEDRNGRRNHDEIRFWRDYVTPGRDQYIYDDNGTAGGLGVRSSDRHFVIMGDYNADPLDGDSYQGAANQLLVNQFVTDTKPSSAGGLEDSALEGMANIGQRGPHIMDTADFNPAGPGNLRVDFVLPSNSLRSLPYRRPLPCERCRGVFWPTEDDPLRYLVGDGFPVVSSDHRLVWVDLILTDRGR